MKSVTADNMETGLGAHCHMDAPQLNWRLVGGDSRYRVPPAYTDLVS